MRSKLFVAVCAVIVFAVSVSAASATTPLSVSKTAEGHWTRAFSWTIDKSVTPASWTLPTGESGTSTYTVAVEKSAGVDEVFVDGEVCVQNNGSVPTENLTITDRIRAFMEGGSRTLADGLLDTSANPVLDPGESYCYPYRFVIEPREGAISYRNEARATITNDARDPGIPLGPSTSAPFDLPSSPTLMNDAITVEDTNGMTWPFSASGSESYPRTFTCDRDEGQHDNTATIVETGQADSASVTVTCTPPPEPGCTLTQGYWKTHSKYGPAPTDPTWALIGENTPFFQSGKSWYQAINQSSAGGNAYFILAHQYIAAQLNTLAGASTTPTVDAALTWASTFFSSHTPTTTLTKPVRADAIARANLLADYNEGTTGPGHCDN